MEKPSLSTVIFFLAAVLFSANTYSQEVLTQSKFLQQVEEQNLDLKSEQAKYDAATANDYGINLPPPMFSLIQMKEEGSSRATGYEIVQEVPFPTKLWGDAKARDYEAQAQLKLLIAKKNEIRARAKLLYFSLWQEQERYELFKEKKNILDDHIKLSRSTARSDNLAAIHLLKAESDRDLLENEILEIEQKFIGKQAEVAIMLNVDSRLKLKAEEPPLSSIPIIGSTDQTPQVMAMQLNLNALNKRELEAKSSWFPDFVIKYKQMGESDMQPESNETMIGITVPFLFFWEPYGKSKQAKNQRLVAEYELQKQKRTIEADKNILVAKAEALKKQIETLNSKLIPRAKKRMNLTHNIAPRDPESLQDHREAMETYPDLKMKSLDLRMQYEEIISNLENFSSTEGSYNE